MLIISLYLQLIVLQISIIPLLLINFPSTAAQTNYVINGNFETPVISSSACTFYNMSSSVSPWFGYFQLKGSAYDKFLGHGQYIDLQQTKNGNITQTVALPVDGYYNLTYYQRAWDGNYSSYRMEIWWNGVLETTFQPNSLSVTQQWIQLKGLVGNNILLFKEVGTLLNNLSLSSYWVGMQIDEISLTLIQDNTTNTTNTTDPTNTTIDPTNTTDPANTTNITDPSNTTDPANTTNITDTSNTTDPNNTTNITDPTNTTDSTNSTSNFTDTANSTNLTTITDGTTIILPDTPTDPTQPIIVDPNIDTGPSEDLQTLGEIVGALMNFPLTQIPVVKYFIILIDDFWLYSYDKHEYHGIMKDIFNTIILIENEKWNLLGKVLPLDLFLNYIPLSSYTDYSWPKILQNQGNDQNLIKSLFTFFIFSVPQNILFVLIFYALFKVTFNYKISLMFRRYSFFICCIFQILLENNLPYFTFVSFCQFELFFCFTFYDKIFMAISTFFFMGCVIFGIGFYISLVKHYKKKSCYFIYSYYRCTPTYYYLTIKILFRGMLKGAVHYFLNNYYFYEMMALILLEIVIVILTITMEKKYEIFISKTFFCLTLVYHFCFAYIDLSFMLQQHIFGFEQYEPFLSKLEQIEESLVYGILATTVMTMIIDFIPLDKIKTSDYFFEELDNQNACEVILPDETKQTMKKQEKKERKPCLKTAIKKSDQKQQTESEQKPTIIKVQILEKKAETKKAKKLKTNKQLIRKHAQKKSI